jgi:hypothetical protein
MKEDDWWHAKGRSTAHRERMRKKRAQAYFHQGLKRERESLD